MSEERVSTLKSNYIKLIRDKRAQKAQEAYEQDFEKDIMSRDEESRKMDEARQKQADYELAAEKDIAMRKANDLDDLGESDIAAVDAVAEKQREKMKNMPKPMDKKKEAPKSYEKKKSFMKQAEDDAYETLVPSSEGHWMDRHIEKMREQDKGINEKRKDMNRRRMLELEEAKKPIR
jgi:hypothetical protein